MLHSAQQPIHSRDADGSANDIAQLPPVRRLVASNWLECRHPPGAARCCILAYNPSKQAGVWCLARPAARARLQGARPSVKLRTSTSEGVEFRGADDPTVKEARLHRQACTRIRMRMVKSIPKGFPFAGSWFR